MNFNTILYRLGISPDNFVSQENEPIKTSDGFIYEVRQRTDRRECTHCHVDDTVIKDYDYVEINCSETDQIKDILRIKKVRFKCKRCGRTFTPEIEGLPSYSRTSSQTIAMIINDFGKMMTFSQIAQRYNLTTARVIQIFDEKIKFVPRRTMPRILCIDEIKFEEEYDQKYCCVLYDFEKKEIVDIIKNRQLPYLKEYFENISESERNQVQFFISDMYDGYSTICKKYFKNARHIIDLFHITAQLTKVITKIRIRVMNSLPDDSIYRRFMKAHWKQFLCRRSDISDRFYTPRNSGTRYHFDDMVFECVKLSGDFLNAYNILQDLYKYNQKTSYQEALDFIEFISNRLINSDNEYLIPVGNTYMKWRFGIANSLARSQNNVHLTNAIAESINNQLKTIIKISYGYHNFERFIKRAMLIITYKPSKKSR